jgi:predicted ester cyclase
MKKIILSLLASSLLVVACNSDKKTDSDNKDTMSSDKKEAMSSGNEGQAEKNRQTALAAVKAFSAHDLDATFKDVTPDAVDYNDGSMAPVKNIDTIKAGIKVWMAAFPDVKTENPEAFSNADGSKVVVIGEATGTFKNDFMGMKATGKSFKYMDGDIFTFNSDGKITSHRSIQSGMTAMAQVGAKMK